MDAEPQSLFRTVVDHISSVPVAVLTIGGTALAFAFNLGFFTAVGMPFLSLFSVQEQIVFSLTGAFIVVALYGVTQTGINIALYANEAPIWSLPWTINAIGFATVIDWLMLANLKAEYDRYGVQEAFVLFLIFATATLSVGLLARDTPAYRKSILLVITLVIVAYLSGLLSGARQVDGERTGHHGHAILKAGNKEYGLVRAGQLYSLIVSPDHIVHAVRTDDLLEMSWGTPVTACTTCR